MKDSNFFAEKKQKTSLFHVCNTLGWFPVLSDASLSRLVNLQFHHAWQSSFLCFIPRCTLFNVSSAFNCALYICWVFIRHRGKREAWSWGWLGRLIFSEWFFSWKLSLVNLSKTITNINQLSWKCKHFGAQNEIFFH